MFKNKYLRFIIFFIVNFLALGLGVLLMNNGPKTEWYTNLNQAPWTPVNWVFGVAWSTIMFCFSFYITKLTLEFNYLDKRLITLFTVQWFLNVCWNFVFFNQHLTELGLVVIILLWLLIGYFTFNYLKKIKWYTVLIVPYLIWMTIATSLNAYIVFYN
ncbi:MAG: TspO/MBR family protein [Polaribacter sp.]|uniref:TspO/MBR family protein n=1 Tax=Polaribacter sp. TaxID=1920175 RepID=UPI0032673289